jgi:hypothetical protein
MMGKVDLIREMESAWAEADRYSKEIAQISKQQAAKPSSDSAARLLDATRKYAEAMQRYRNASRGYYEITVSQPPRAAP